MSVNTYPYLQGALKVTLPYLVINAEKKGPRTVRDLSDGLMRNTGRHSDLGPLYTFAAWRTQVLPILV